ncbi:unnamed protein product, partial [Allacma fusca]
MEPNLNQDPLQLSPTIIHRSFSSSPPPPSESPVTFVRRLEFSFYPSSNNNTEPGPSADDYFQDEININKRMSKEQIPDQFLIPSSEEASVNDPDDEESYSNHNKRRSSHHSDSQLSWNNNNDNDQPLENCSGASNRGKQIDGVTMDFKLQVLRWAYTKTIHSAGHHFNLERCVVRNWMMNEEKIYNSASEKGNINTIFRH